MIICHHQRGWGGCIQRNTNTANSVNDVQCINPLNAELNPICHLLAVLEAHHILHVSRIRVKMQYYKLKSLKMYKI